MLAEQISTGLKYARIIKCWVMMQVLDDFEVSQTETAQRHMKSLRRFAYIRHHDPKEAAAV
jgi:hypothetical protein